MKRGKRSKNPLLEASLLAGDEEQQLEAKDLISAEELDSMNSPQDLQSNLKALGSLGGVQAVLQRLDVLPEYGLSSEQVEAMGRLYGRNFIPDAPMKSILELLKETLSDFTLIILMIAAGELQWQNARGKDGGERDGVLLARLVCVDVSVCSRVALLGVVLGRGL